jgi:hypothetical protein
VSHQCGVSNLAKRINVILGEGGGGLGVVQDFNKIANHLLLACCLRAGGGGDAAGSVLLWVFVCLLDGVFTCATVLMRDARHTPTDGVLGSEGGGEPGETHQRHPG